MKTFVIAFFALVAGASAAAIQQEPIAILSQTQENNPDGSFISTYETANGIVNQERGTVTNPGREDQSQIVEGQASWTSPEGIPITLTWTAGPEGVVFGGSHLPQAPPAPEIPAAIQRSLDWIAAHPYKEPVAQKNL